MSKLFVLSVHLVALLLPSGDTLFANDEAKNLASQVIIRRTHYGIPHILAENERAAGFGMAYAQAEDHLHSIAKLILKARGELSENFGGTEENIQSDFWNRHYRIYPRAKETYHRLDQDWRDILEGYAAGINYYIQLHRSELDDWIQPIRAHDVAAHGLTGVARFAFNRGRIVDKFIESLGKGDDVVVPPEEMMGSNLWAFDGTRTKSGNTILMGNPHQAWSEVATYYEAHLTIPGKVNFYGSTFVGRPILTTGFNEFLGWTHTVNYPDLEEIYSLSLVDDDPHRYWFDGGAVSIKSETAKIAVKGGADQTREFEYTPLGPVIHRTAKKIYVLRSVAYEEYRFYQQWFQLEQAKNFEEFRRILDDLIIPMFNIGYADREGNIYYLWNGTIPKLPHNSHAAIAIHAKSSRDIWTQVHEISELPQLLNPAGGYVMNSNSAPYFTSLRVPLNPKEYPSYFPRNDFSLRSQHSMRLINNNDRYSLENVVKMKHSMHVPLADRVKNELIAAVEISQPDRETQQALKLLKIWDNSTSKDSRGSTLFEAWWTEYSKFTQAERYVDFSTPWSADDPIRTPSGLADRERAVAAFLRAIKSTKKRFGSWDVSWGESHRVRFGNNVDLPVGGSSNAMGSFRRVNYRDDEDGKYVANGGDSFVFAVEFEEVPRAFSVVAYSQSEYEDSSHFSDQAELYSNHKMKKVAFSEEDIALQLLSKYHPGEE